MLINNTDLVLKSCVTSDKFNYSHYDYFSETEFKINFCINKDDSDEIYNTLKEGKNRFLLNSKFGKRGFFAREFDKLTQQSQYQGNWHGKDDFFSIKNNFLNFILTMGFIDPKNEQQWFPIEWTKNGIKISFEGKFKAEWEAFGANYRESFSWKFLGKDIDPEDLDDEMTIFNIIRETIEESFNND